MERFDAAVTARQNRSTAIKQSSSPRWIQLAFWLSLLIAVAAVLRRLIALARPSTSGPPPMINLDSTFASHSLLTLAHILPALLFVLLAPLMLLRKGVWRELEQFFFLLGAIVGLTAYAMSIYAVGGWVERSAVLVFNSLFLFSLTQAFRHARHGDELRKHTWLLRAVGILLGIATTRPVMGLFFATSSLTHLEPRQFFGLAFWIGFSINTAAVEVWLRTRKHQPTT